MDPRFDIHLNIHGKTLRPTLGSRMIGGVGIIRGGLDIVIIINNRGWGGQGWKNSVGGFLVLLC